jgi:hypothetical protein
LAVDVEIGQGADTGNAVSVSAGKFGHFGRELLLMADYAADEVLLSPSGGYVSCGFEWGYGKSSL